MELDGFHVKPCDDIHEYPDKIYKDSPQSTYCHQIGFLQISDMQIVIKSILQMHFFSNVVAENITSQHKSLS